MEQAVQDALKVLRAAEDKMLQTLQGETSLKEKYLTVKEAMEYTKCSRWTLRRALIRNEILATKVSQARAGKVLYDKASIDHWLEGNMYHDPYKAENR